MSKVERVVAAYGATAAEEWEGRFLGIEGLETLQLEVVRSATLLGLKAGALVLDVGCGTGRAAELFPQDIYVGVDRTLQFLRYGLQHRGGIGRHFLRADLGALPFPRRAFDLILLLGTLESEKALAAPVNDLLSYLRPGGRLHFTVQNKRNLPARMGNLFGFRYRQSFWGRRQLRRVVGEPGREVRMMSLFVLPPGLVRALSKGLGWVPGMRRGLMKGVLALEGLNLRYDLGLGYEWHISVSVLDPSPAS